MNTAELDTIVTTTFEECKKLLITKGGEYAGGSDRLANFKRGAGRVGVKPLTVLHIYLSKHLDAIDTYVRKAQCEETQVLSEPIEGRIDDAINYLLLAKALIAERSKPMQKVVDSLALFTHSGHTVFLGEAEAVCWLDLLKDRLTSSPPPIWLGEQIKAYKLPKADTWINV